MKMHKYVIDDDKWLKCPFLLGGLHLKKYEHQPYIIMSLISDLIYI